RVSRAENHIDDARSAKHLPEPVRKGELGLIAALLKERQRSIHVAGTDEEVEILGLALNLEILHETERPANQKRDRRSGKRAERFRVRFSQVIVVRFESGHTGLRRRWPSVPHHRTGWRRGRWMFGLCERRGISGTHFSLRRVGDLHVEDSERCAI